MNVNIRTPERLTVLASIVALTALVILFIDLGIKKAIIRESGEVRTWISYLEGDRRAVNLQNKPRPEDGTVAGGIKNAPHVSDPVGLVILHGDRSSERKEA
jgi:hypothetical protein